MLPRLIFLFLAGIGPTALGQGVGGSSPTQTTVDLRDLIGLPGSGEPPITHLGEIGSQVNPIPVSLDPLGPQWTVHLSRSPLIVPEAPIVLRQDLTIAGAYAWTGWQIDVNTRGVEWFHKESGFGAAGVLADGVAPPGYQMEYVGDSLLFSFDPLPPGTQVTIVSRWRYVGTDSVDSFDVRQFPTPEPATTTIAGAAAVLLVGRRRFRIV